MDTLAAALKLVIRCQFSILPLHTIENDLCTCGDRYCSSPGKHPVASLAPHGVEDATKDPAIINQWWALFPDLNIGIATGTVSDVLVIDIDAGKGGTSSWSNLEQRHGSVLDTWAVATGGGGYHYYFRAVDNVRNRVGFVPGVDVRSDKGYVVAPPSLHQSGNRYEWMDGMKPSASMQYPADAPPWLLQMLGTTTAKAGGLRIPEKIGEGERNDMLTRIAGAMRRINMSKDAALAALKIENELRCDPPIDERELERIVWSVDRYPAEMAGRMTFGGQHG